MTRIGELVSVLVIASFTMAPVNALAHNVERVWFAPSEDSPDLVNLFRQPDLWSRARGHISVFKLSPRLLTADAKGQRNSLKDLQGVDAFGKLHLWGIKIASEEGAIKPWDCTGIKAAQVTNIHMRDARAAGGAIDIIAMDEPLKTGRDVCRLSAMEAARRTAAYVHMVDSGDAAKAQSAAPMVGDIEPYPTIAVGEIEEWTDALIASGFKPAFMHVDINGHFVDVHPEVDMAEDMKALQAFFRQRGIPFGVILWSGYNPLNSDRAYYDHVIKLVRTLRNAVGMPDELIFQSWVQRSTKDCPESNLRCSLAPCTKSDPPYCGEKSVPLNLPENDAAHFSHTRLINDALAELDASCCQAQE